MADPPIFRWIAVGVFLAAIAISGTYRRRAEREGSPLLERAPDRAAIVVLRVLGATLWILVLVDPPWMVWSRFPLSDTLRWVGAGFALALLALFVWVLHSIGTNITPTFVTRREHSLVTTGPYRWVRHPLYSAGLVMHAALALLLANWLVAAVGLVILALLPLRIRREDDHLAARFGDAYRDYRRRSGSLFPRFRP